MTLVIGRFIKRPHANFELPESQIQHSVIFPKPTPRASQACPICNRSFRQAAALYRHALKCKVRKPVNRLGSVAMKTKGPGYLFDSRLEGGLFTQLKLRERAGELSDIKVKPNVRITDAQILVIPDFSAVTTETGELRYHEAKGFRTEIWIMKMRLWRHYGPAPIDVYVAGPNGPIHSETIEIIGQK